MTLSKRFPLGTPCSTTAQQVQFKTSESLAPRHPAEQFLQLLGKDPAQTYFRTIRPGGGANSSRGGKDLHGFNLQALTRDNLAGESIYFVTGNSNNPSRLAVAAKDVISCPALFAEWDDKPMEWQLQAWQQLGLPEPTIQLLTGGKSVHCYWLLTEAMTPAQWRPLQAQLIDHCESDRQCKDPSRLMRLPGFNYIDKTTGKPNGKVAEVVHSSANRYSTEQIEACLPSLLKPQPATPATPPRGLPHRTLQEIEAAAACIPERVVGGNTYEPSRRALCGCAAALAEIGLPEDQALDLLASKWPDRAKAKQALESSSTREAASFWKIAKDNGFDLKRAAGKVIPITSKRTKEQQEHNTAQEPEQEHPSSYSKPVTMATHAVLIQLPQRIGAPRLNIRTRDVHLPDRIISGDEASRLYLQLSSDREKWPKETTFDAVQLLAEQASFDPVAEYLDGLTASTEPLPLEEWQRLDLLLFNIDDPVAAAFLPRFFITAVARTFKPGCIGRQWPVLIGEKGIGKSDLPKLLFNIPGLPDGFVDNPGDLQRDGLMKAHRSWCVELAELNGISRRADKEHLKAFLSERVDTYRAPYSRAPAAHPRRHVFWGTSNGPPMNEADPRLVCIPLPDRMLPFTAVEAAKDSLWARAVQQYRLGTCWHTVGDDFKALLKERNEDHTVTDPWADQVADHLEVRLKSGALPVAVPELMNLLELDNSQRNNSVAVRLIELAGSLGWVKAKRRPAPGIAPKQGLWPKG